MALKPIEGKHEDSSDLFFWDDVLKDEGPESIFDFPSEIKEARHVRDKFEIAKITAVSVEKESDAVLTNFIAHLHGLWSKHFNNTDEESADDLKRARVVKVFTVVYDEMKRRGMKVDADRPLARVAGVRQPTLEEELEEEARHARDKCMSCEKPPVVEVLWANGKGHAWFCAECYDVWKKESDWHEVDYEKEIEHGIARMKFSDRNSPESLSEEEKKGPGRGWWGPPKGTHGEGEGRGKDIAFSSGVAPDKDWMKHPNQNVASKEASDFLSEGLERPWISSGLRERGKVKAEIVSELSKRSGLSKEEANSALEMWARTANDNDMRSLSMQAAAAEEIGVKMSRWQQGKTSSLAATQQEMRQTLETEKARLLRIIAGDEELGPFEFVIPEEEIVALDTSLAELSSASKPLYSRGKERALVGSMYNYTQEKLRETGYEPSDTVQLFRGVKHGKTNPGFHAGQVIGYEGNVMESWSVSRGTAHVYAHPGVGEYASVVTMAVPVRNILGTARTGFGCLIEGEFIVLGTIPGSEALVDNVLFGGE